MCAPIDYSCTKRRATFCAALLAGSLVLLGPGSAMGQQVPDVPIEEMSAYLDRFERLGFSGGVLIAAGGRVAHEGAYGFRDALGSEPMPENAVFTMGSITKPFTAAAILELQERGLLHVHDPITRFFDDVPRDKAEITLHHLLTHTAGLDDTFGPDPERIGREELVDRVLGSELVEPVGERYRYSNAGYSLLAAVIERVSGTGYERFLRDELLLPSGLVETGYVIPAFDTTRLARGTFFGDDWGTLPERVYGPDGPGWNLLGNGGLLTTLRDLYRWTRSLRDTLVLGPGTLEEHLAPRVPMGTDGGSSHGYGWSVVETARGTRMISYAGSNGIFTAVARWWPEEDLTLLVFATDPLFPATWLAPRLSGYLFGAPPDTLPRAGDPGPCEPCRWPGEYTLDNGGAIRVTRAPDRLNVAPLDSLSVQAIASAAGGDAPIEPGWAVPFVPTGNGRFIFFDVRRSAVLPIRFEQIGCDAVLLFGPIRGRREG